MKYKIKEHNRTLNENTGEKKRACYNLLLIYYPSFVKFFRREFAFLLIDCDFFLQTF